MCLCPQDGWTALYAAAREGKVDVVRLLTEAQALVNIRTKVYTHTMDPIGLLDFCTHTVVTPH